MITLAAVVICLIFWPITLIVLALYYWPLTLLLGFCVLCLYAIRSFLGMVGRAL